MTRAGQATTWGTSAPEATAGSKPSSPPAGAVVLVLGRGADGHWQFLLLHSRHDSAGGCRWAPPVGPLDDELASVCARRVLAEATGMKLGCLATAFGEPDWPVFMALAPFDAELRLDAAYDRHEWVSPAEAAARCDWPEVSDAISKVAEMVGAGGR